MCWLSSAIIPVGDPLKMTKPETIAWFDQFDPKTTTRGSQLVTTYLFLEAACGVQQ